MENQKEERRVWDYSTVPSFQTCRKKYYYEHVRNLRPAVKGVALSFGTAVHDALDTYYQSTDKLAGMTAAIKEFHSKYQTPEGEELRTNENGEKMLLWYFKKYAHEPFKTVTKPEQGFVFYIGDVLFGGRLDLPVEWDGQLWIMEHKTTTRLTGNYFNQFELDKQVTGYIIALEEFTGKKCAGAIINALEPWKEVKRVTAATKQPEDHFLRKPLTRSQELKDRFRYNIQAIVRDILWCEKHNEFYEAEKKEVCTYYNRPCPYLQLCLYGEDERIIKRDYVVEKWEPFANAGGEMEE